MEWYLWAGILFGLLTFLIALGVPIAYSLVIASLPALISELGTDNSALWIGGSAFGSVDSIVLLSLPAFILLGEMASPTRGVDSLFVVIRTWFGRVPGSLAIVSQWLGASFGAISGSAAVSVQVVGRMTYGRMMDAGYDRSLAAGAIAGAGAIDNLIPPSIIMIIYAVSADVPVTALWAAGLVPGVLMATLYSAYIGGRSILNPSMAPRIAVPRLNPTGLALQHARLAPLLLVAVLVLGSMFVGAVTPTEAGAVGVVAILALAFLERSASLKALGAAISSAVRVTAFIMLIVVGGKLFSFSLAQFQIPQETVKLVTDVNAGVALTILALVIVYTLLGMFIDGPSLIIVTTPVVLPVVTALGIDPVVFGVVVVILVEIAIVTPPVGVSLFIVKGLSPDLTLGTIIKGVIPYIVLDYALIALVLLFPDIALWLPRAWGLYNG